MGVCASKVARRQVVPQVLPVEESESESENSGSDNEVLNERPEFYRKRAYACSVEAHGAWNKRKPFKHILHDKTPIQKRTIKAALRQCMALDILSKKDLETLANATAIVSIRPDEEIFLKGDHGDAVYVVLLGAIDIYTGKKDPFSNNNVPLATLSKGKILGDSTMIFNLPRTASAYGAEGGTSVLGRLERSFFMDLLVDRQKEWRARRMELLRGAKLLETLKDEQIAQLAEVLELRVFDEGDPIITQGQKGTEFFIMQSGEAVVEVETGLFSADVQEHRRYNRGDLFGERALLSGQPRAASIIARSRTETLVLSRRKFERLLGPLSQLQGDLYLTDPRKIIADFYSPGDHNGPGGALALQGLMKGWLTTTWMAIYRPTSRDAIAKMLAGTAVGKGLNVKGKSAKKGMLSGLVPFIQISKNEHKIKVEKPCPVSRLMIFYKSKDNRDQCLRTLRGLIEEVDLNIADDKSLRVLDEYADGQYSVWGLDMPEAVMHEAYIMMPDISPIVGWETGRPSEPAFMDMNLHAIRAYSENAPRVVLYQFDQEDPMNPRGLLVAYAEKYVKPVVSDFDTFTIGSQNMLYKPLPEDQLELARWSLDRSEEILQEVGADGWNSRWLRILQRENARGFHPEFPKYGFGDMISYDLIHQVVQSTLACGAIRHGAECFNFYFPQELDDEYLVVWDKFPDLPWAYKTQGELLEFLIDRVYDGYSFPVNPVWPVRDKGWYAVVDALSANSETLGVMQSWWVPHSGIKEKIKELHCKYPEGFYTLKDPQPSQPKPAPMPQPDNATNAPSNPPAIAGGSIANESRGANKRRSLEEIEGMSNLQAPNKVAENNNSEAMLSDRSESMASKRQSLKSPRRSQLGAGK